MNFTTNDTTTKYAHAYFFESGFLRPFCHVYTDVVRVISGKCSKAKWLTLLNETMAQTCLESLKAKLRLTPKVVSNYIQLYVLTFFNYKGIIVALFL